MLLLTKLTKPRLLPLQCWSFVAYRSCSSVPDVSTGYVREVLKLQLEKGFAAQACVAWQALLPMLQHQRPTFVVVQSSANHQTASAAFRLVDAQLKALSGSSKQTPAVVGFSARPWVPEGQSTAARKLTDSQWKLQRHVRITAAVLPDAEAAGFHTVSASFPKIPNLEAALTVRPPHVMLFPHPSFTDDQLASLIIRLESGFQGAETLGLVPIPPLPDQDAEEAEGQLELFRSEAAAILAEANAAGDLAAPLAVAAAEAEALAHTQLECPAQEGASSHGQEEAAIFLRDSSFMQGAVGLTLMPPDAASRVSIKDLAALSCFLFGSDKSYGLFMSPKLVRLVHGARDQQSRIAPPADPQEAASPFLTATDLIQLLASQTGTPAEAGDSNKTVSALPGGTPRGAKLQPQSQDLQGETAPQLGDASPVSSLASATAAGSQPPQESASPTAISASFAQDWKPARVAPAGLRLIPQTPQPSTTATEQIRTAGEQGAPVTEHISTTGEQGASVTEQISTAGVQGASVTEQISIAGRQGASVQEEASAVSLLNPESSRLEYAEVQTDSQLPLFALDSVLWPNQLMRLRVFEPRYTRLIRCCQETQGCFGLASWGVGITAKFDQVEADGDGSYSVTIRGGRRFLVQEGSAQVVPGSFGLTAVLPQYIYDKDLHSPEAAALAAAAAHLMSQAHNAAQMANARPGEEQPEDAASRWREGVLEDAGASSAFASAFNIANPSQQQLMSKTRPVRTDWTPAAAQELSFLLGSALPVPPTLRRKWLRMESLTQRLQQQVELLQETRPRLIMGGILDGLPTDSRFHDLLYHTDAVNT